MEWGQQMRNHQTYMLDSTYQNSNYSRERETRKTLILDVDDANYPTSGDTTIKPLVNFTDFTIDLQEPFIIDKLSDIYIDSFTTFNCNLADSANEMAFILDIDIFNIQVNSNNSNIFNKILIPNEQPVGGTVANTIIHKGKKLNYICQINPGKISQVNGKITSMNNATMFTTSGRFIAEFVIVAHD